MNTTFDCDYTAPTADLQRMHGQGLRGQWNAERDLAWDTAVDPEYPARAVVPADFFDFRLLEEAGVRLDAAEEGRFRLALATWMLSQFLHGEQGALFAAAQAVESAPSMDVKSVASIQVVDESRHVAVFERYLRTKLGRVYTVNDSLFAVLRAVLDDVRWDVKLVGMQIIVEGLALSAFGGIYKRTQEPLLKELLRRVLEDEARHVRFGVLALRGMHEALEARELQEREDWVFEISRLMRNRFRAVEVYEEWFSGILSREKWQSIVDGSRGMAAFNGALFARLVRNLIAIGLFSDRTAARFAREGLFSGAYCARPALAPFVRPGGDASGEGAVKP